MQNCVVPADANALLRWRRPKLAELDCALVRVDAHQEFDVCLRILELVLEELDRVLRAAFGEEATQMPHTLHLIGAGHNLFFLTRARLSNVNRREDALVGKGVIAPRAFLQPQLAHGRSTIVEKLLAGMGPSTF